MAKAGLRISMSDSKSNYGEQILLFCGVGTPACLLDPCSRLKNLMDLAGHHSAHKSTTRRTGERGENWIWLLTVTGQQTKGASYEHLPGEEQYQCNPRAVAE